MDYLKKCLKNYETASFSSKKAYMKKSEIDKVAKKIMFHLVFNYLDGEIISKSLEEVRKEHYEVLRRTARA